MKLHRYFPLGKAYGDAFCNRVEETAKLVANMVRGAHTFLLAPRRYGKSSLCEQAFRQAELPWAVDFHLAVTEKEAERLIVKGVSELIGKSVRSIDKWAALIRSALKQITPKFDISAGPFSLELTVSEQSSPAESVAEVLLLLDRLLQENNKQAVLLFDEFQEVGQFSEGRGIEGAIRHAAQETQSLSIVFSGSNPHVLKTLFENQRRPLYKLCKKLRLDRISVEHYRGHLNKAAQLAWRQDLSAEVFDRIMDLTERHPYYVNALCDELWADCESCPDTVQVAACWHVIVEGERSDLIKDFLRLSVNQRKALIYLANNTGDALFSQEASRAMAIAPGSLHAAVAILLEKDFIELHGRTYRLVIPLYRVILGH
jgi:hypothetical protein